MTKRSFLGVNLAKVNSYAWVLSSARQRLHRTRCPARHRPAELESRDLWRCRALIFPSKSSKGLRQWRCHRLRRHCVSHRRLEPGSICPGETLQPDPSPTNVPKRWPASPCPTSPSFTLSPLTSAQHSDLRVLAQLSWTSFTEVSVELNNPGGDLKPSSQNASQPIFPWREHKNLC